MSEIIVSSVKRIPPTTDVAVYIDKEIITRFISFSISHSIDVVPMSFTLEYGLSEGEAENTLQFIGKKTTTKTNKKGLFKVGQKIEIYLEKKKVLTGYIDNVSESYAFGQHVLYVDGRSITSVLVDVTTDKPSGLLPSSVVTLRDAANYMFEGFGIKVIDNTDGETKRNIAAYTQIDLTTQPYNYVANLALYEGKLLYDNELGCMVIDNVPEPTKEKKQPGETDNGYVPVGTDKDGITIMEKKQKTNVLTEENSNFQQISNHRTTLGRYREYRFVINSYGGQAGIDQSLQVDITVEDPDKNELPPGKKQTIINTAAYPDSSVGGENGLAEFTKTLAQYTANKNWGRGQTVTALAKGYINPMTNTIWKINDLVNFDYEKPKIKGYYVVQSLNFSLDSYQGRVTELVFVRRESLLPEPVTLSPLIAGVNEGASNTETSSNSGNLKDSSDPKTQKLNVPDTPPDNAKPIKKEN